MALARVGSRDRVLLWAVAISFAVHIVALARVHLPGQATLAAAPLPLTVRMLQQAAPAPTPPVVPKSPARPAAPLAVQAIASEAALPLAVAASPATPVEAMRSIPPVAVTSSVASPAPVILPRFDAEYLNNPRPTYPALSRRLGEQGRVLLRVLVSGEGRTREVQVKEGSGFVRLDTAARAAVAHWRFVPARQGSENVEAWVQVPVSFALD